MIVKNEAPIIRKTLENLCAYLTLDRYEICDTGSTDNTIEVIRTFFEEKGIQGNVSQHEWVDFGTNRTLALREAYQKTDYVLIFDADDSIHGDLVLPASLEHDQYLFCFDPEYAYHRPLLLNNRSVEWEFIGVLHEYLSPIDKHRIVSSSEIKGSYHIQSGKHGSRSQDPLKYQKDADLLEKHYEIQKNQNPMLAGRYAFYCAQSHKDQNNIEKAIQWYKICVDNPIQWAQEKYVACMHLGSLYQRQSQPMEALRYWMRSDQYDQERIEGVVEACRYYFGHHDHVHVHMIHRTFGKRQTRPSNTKLFMTEEYYRFPFLEYYNSISAYYCHEHASGYESLKRILFSSTLNQSQYLRSCLENLLFYKTLIEKDSDIERLKLFYRVQDLLSQFPMYRTRGAFQSWNLLYDSSIDGLTAPITILPSPPRKNRKHPLIFFTITACKRLDLFKKTMNSILRHWKDLDRIDYWFCVDDRSTPTDRQEMMRLYPWFDFYWKTELEAGHRCSMNIIFNKIVELNPVYWVQMEDDFCFFQEMDVITHALKGLQKLGSTDHHVGQIMFNRHYAEIIEDYSFVGHVHNNMDNDDDDHFLIHRHIPDPEECARITYRNYHYWPHFSFRPSLILCDAVRSLGNFDSLHTFFERDYATRWFENGYKTAFFPFIISRHIGKLTSQNNKDTPNAYALNHQNQF
jgi:glycosyltransferase involved in cell wall biosynthesis